MQKLIGQAIRAGNSGRLLGQAIRANYRADG